MRRVPVAHIGTYRAARPAISQNCSNSHNCKRVEVTASGSWTLTAGPLSSARRISGGRALGSGDDVVLLDGTGRMTITHDGESNFAVLSHGDGRDLLVNEIGRYSGTVLVSSDALLVEIGADGNWTLDLN